MIVNCNFQICALKVTDRARARIEKAGGEVITFDTLARRAPTGKNTMLIQGMFNNCQGTAECLYSFYEV